jgi:DnaK suppressor protein
MDQAAKQWFFVYRLLCFVMNTGPDGIDLGQFLSRFSHGVAPLPDRVVTDKLTREKRNPVMERIAQMDDAATNRFRALLEDLLVELSAADDLGREAQDVVALDQQAMGRLSRQDALINQSMARATQGRRDTEARRIQAALDRLEAGEFGYCVDCGEEIAHERLRLDPAAPKCISCARG